MAKKCPPPKDYSEVIARTKKMVTGWLETIDQAELPNAINMLHEELQAENPERATAFREVIKQIHPGYIADAAFDEDLDLSVKPVGVSDIDIRPFINEIDEINATGQAGVDLEDADNRSSNVETKYAEMQIGLTGIEAFKPIYMASIGQRVTPKEFAEFMESIGMHDNFDVFVRAIDDKFSGYKGTDEQLRQLRQLFTVFQPSNWMKTEDKLTLIWTNLNPREPDIFKAIQGKREFQHVREIDLKSRTREPERTSANFIDISTVDIFNEEINGVTIYVPLSKMVEVRAKKTGPNPEKNDPGWFAVDANLKITEHTLNEWNAQLGTMNKMIDGKKRSVPHVIAGINSGDPGTLMITQIPDDIFKTVLPQAEVKDLVAKGTLPEKTAKYLASKSYSLHYALRDARPKLKERNVAPGGPIKAKRTVQSQLMRTRYDQMLEIADAMSAKNYGEYFLKELENEVIGKKEYDEFIANIGKIPVRYGDRVMPMHMYLAGIIATHEWWKGVKYNTYAINDDSRKTYDRSRLNKTPGIIEVGRGPRKHFIFDQERVDIYYNGEKVEHIINVPGLGKININDGMSWVSTADLNTTQEVLGRYPIHKWESNVREVKAVDVERSEDGWDYMEKKHSSQQAIPGIEIRDQRAKAGDPPLLYTAMEMGQVVIFALDQNGESVPIDEVSDLDAVKTAVGKWDIRKRRATHYIDDTKESSRRIVILPPTVAHRTSPGPRQWMSNLYIDSITNKTTQDNLNKFRNTFEEYMLSEADKHIELLLDVFEHPSFMRKLLRRKWAQEVDSHDNLKNMLEATNYAGVHHPTYMSQIRPMLKNSIINDGILQFRTFEDKIGGERQPIVGTDGVLKADIGRELGDNHNEFMASAELQVLRDYTERLLFAHDAKNILKNIKTYDLEGLPPSEFAISQAKKDYYSLAEEDRIDALNFALKNILNIRAMTWRTPNLSLGALGVDKMVELKPDEGEALYFTPENVAKTKQGDHDIDHTNIIIIPDKLADDLSAFMETTFFKEQQALTANLDLFKFKPSASMADYNGRLQDAVTQIQGQQTKGITANMKVLTAVLSYKFGDITFTDGTVMRAKKPTERVIMDYAPLDQDSYTIDQIEAQLPAFASVVEAENGEWYLKTTVEHEHVIIANAATDHSKKGRLVDIWKYNGPDWRFKRMFKVAGNKPITSFHIKALNKLNRMFNYSDILKGNDWYKNPMDMADYFYHAKQLHEYLQLTPEQQEMKIKEATNSEKMHTRTNEAGNKETVTTELGIASIEVKENRVVSSEKLIVRPIEQMLRRYGEDMPALPGLTEWDEQKIVHHFAVKDLETSIMDNIEAYGITTEAINAAEKFIVRFAAGYYDMFYPQKNEKGEYITKSSMRKAEFTEEIWQYVKLGEKELNKLKDLHGDGVAIWSTLLFAQGVTTMQGTQFINRKNIRHFPPGEVMDVKTYQRFMNFWETHHQDVATRTNFDALEEIGRHKWKSSTKIKERIC